MLTRTLEDELGALFTGEADECLVCGEAVRVVSGRVECEACGSSVEGVQSGGDELQLTFD